MTINYLFTFCTIQISVVLFVCFLILCTCIVYIVLPVYTVHIPVRGKDNNFEL